MAKLLLQLCAVLVFVAGQQDLRFSISRPFMIRNLLTLFCKNATGHLVTSPLFFRNGVQLNHFLRFTDFQGNKLHYIVYRMREGEFTCGIMDEFGTIIRSNSLTIVGE